MAFRVRHEMNVEFPGIGAEKMQELELLELPATYIKSPPNTKIKKWDVEPVGERRCTASRSPVFLMKPAVNGPALHTKMGRQHLQASPHRRVTVVAIGAGPEVLKTVKQRDRHGFKSDRETLQEGI